MAKTKTVRARVEPELKAEAEATLEQIGLSPTAAITLFYRKIIQDQGLPFELRLPNAETREAMLEARTGRGVTRAASADDLFAKLDADEEDETPEGESSAKPKPVRRRRSWPMLEPRFTGAFKRDRKRAAKRGKDIRKLDAVVRQLVN
jgi:DNA-damage-inducible protein J